MQVGRRMVVNKAAWTTACFYAKQESSFCTDFPLFPALKSVFTGALNSPTYLKTIFFAELLF